MYGLQHGALAHTEQKAIKGPKITNVETFKRENQRSNLYKKRETRNTLLSQALESEKSCIKYKDKCLFRLNPYSCDL